METAASPADRVIVDYHVHLRAADETVAHTVEAVERFVEVALARGVDEIGFSEHVYYFSQTAGVWEIAYQSERCERDLAAYCEAVLEAKRRGLPVKLGIEVDWVPSRAERLGEILAPYPWDYLLGSVHYVEELGIDVQPSLIDALGAEPAWARYFHELTELAASGLVDVLAHPDLIKFFGVRPADAFARSVHEEFVGKLERTGVALEVSTAGRYKPVCELYPDPGLLELARRRGIPVTLASDAHVPENVGRDLDLAVELARAAGYETVTVFDGRRGRQEPLG